MPTKKPAIKKLKATDQEEVLVFLKSLEHPLKKPIEEVRKIILASHPDLTEHIKWNAPSFCIGGDDRITFNLHGKDFFRLIFHCGVKVKSKNGKGRLFEDTTGLLTWAADDRAVASFKDLNDVKQKKEALIKTIKQWLLLTT